VRQSSGFRFVDLFAGIGGMRLGFESIGGTCTFSVEWDRFARQTYERNFGPVEGGDIRDVDDLPDHALIAAGFPCQPFSLAGVSKKTSLGRAHGFDDLVQGTLFFEIVRLARRSGTPILFLENVKHLTRHDRGKTFAVILSTLQELGYNVSHQLVDSRPFVPQRRERIFIVALHRDVFGDQHFRFPVAPSTSHRMAEVLDPIVSPEFTKSREVWRYLQAYARKHRLAGNGFGFGLVGPDDVARTLSARYFKDGSEILVRQLDGPPRMLTPRECARLMGFPAEFEIPVSKTQAYRQFGNAVVVPVVSHLAQAMAEQELFERATNRRQLAIAFD
jgi:DNA (cytosine-5)-methyltransferase 1